MTTLLAVETSGPRCSVAIHARGEWVENTQNVQRLHNRVLLAQIDATARRAGVAPREFALVAFGAGPGSFTGIRIAAATAQAVAFASAARIVPVSSSLALAAAARQSPAGASLPGIITVTRSRQNADYVAAYAFSPPAPAPAAAPDGCSLIVPDILYQGGDLPLHERLGDWVGVGDQPAWWGARGADFLTDCTVTAGTIGRLALQLAAAGHAVAPEAGLPVYVSGDSPWRPMDAPAAAPARDA